MPIKYELSNFDYVFGGNRTHDPYAYSLEHYLLDYQGTQLLRVVTYDNIASSTCQIDLVLQPKLMVSVQCLRS